MKEQLKKILYAKCISESATNKAVEEVCNLIESNQKEFEEWLEHNIECFKGVNESILIDVLTKYKELNKNN